MKLARVLYERTLTDVTNIPSLSPKGNSLVGISIVSKVGVTYSISLLEWLKAGFLVTVVTVAVAQLMIYLMQPKPLT